MRRDPGAGWQVFGSTWIGGSHRREFHPAQKSTHYSCRASECTSEQTIAASWRPSFWRKRRCQAILSAELPEWKINACMVCKAVKRSRPTLTSVYDSIKMYLGAAPAPVVGYLVYYWRDPVCFGPFVCAWQPAVFRCNIASISKWCLRSCEWRLSRRLSWPGDTERASNYTPLSTPIFSTLLPFNYPN